jgi:hypothetical protein
MAKPVRCLKEGRRRRRRKKKYVGIILKRLHQRGACFFVNTITEMTLQLHNTTYLIPETYVKSF